jgi:hypothetical protein
MTSRKKYRKAGLGGEKQPRDGRPENEKMTDTHAKLGEPVPAQNKISQNERARDRETAGPTKAESPDEEFEQRSSDRIALYARHPALKYVSLLTVIQDAIPHLRNQRGQMYQRDLSGID